MPAVRAQVTIKTVDNVGENFVTNSWAFNTPDPIPDRAGLSTALWTFYTQLAGFYPSSIAQNGHEIKWYLLPGVKPNYPFHIETKNFTSAPSGVRLPSEVALVASFQGDKTAGLPQARRRGRIYFGPLDASLNTDGRPTTATCTTLGTQVQTLCNDVIALPTTGAYLGVWSEVDQSITPVSNGWVDNAFDTQRRRGEDPTLRVNWTI